MDGFKFFVLISALVLSVSKIFAQQDTIGVEEDSVVYIDAPPVVIQKHIMHEEKVYNQWFLELSGALFFHKNKHCPCEDLKEYRNEMKKTVTPVLGYGFGANLRYLPNGKKITYSIGLSMSSFNEKFSHVIDTVKMIRSKNTFRYLDLGIGAGYWLFRKHKAVSIIMNAEFLVSRLVKNKGYALDYSDFSVLTNEQANREARWMLGGLISSKLLFFNNSRTKIYIEPYMRMNFTSVLEYRQNYFLERWSYGGRVGLLYVL